MSGNLLRPAAAASGQVLWPRVAEVVVFEDYADLNRVNPLR